MIRATAYIAALVFWAGAAVADAALTRLTDLLSFPEYTQITRAEGLDGLDGLSQDLLGRPADGQLRAQMDRIYDVGRMQEILRAALDGGLTSADIEAASLFFGSEIGERIGELELAARSAMSDDAIKHMTQEAWIRAEEERPWLFARIAEANDVSDLVERNVTGALTSILQFYRGLADGQALSLSRDEMLIEVWSQEDAIRAETELWLGGYMHLAFEPLSEDDLETYLAFWQTDTGRALNAAIFEGFNAVHDEIAYASGRLFALSMAMQDL